MLLFVTGPLLEKIRRGEKTTTVRPWKRTRLQPGRRCTFNGRVRVTLSAVEQCRLGDLRAPDAHADGFASLAAFRELFATLYPRLDASAPVVVLRWASSSVQHLRA